MSRKILNAFKSEVKTLLSMSFADIPTSQQHSRGAARVKAHDRFAAPHSHTKCELHPAPGSGSRVPATGDGAFRRLRPRRALGAGLRAGQPRTDDAQLDHGGAELRRSPGVRS